MNDYYTLSPEDISKNDAKETEKFFHMCKRTWVGNELVLETKLDSFCDYSVENVRSYASDKIKDVDINKLTKAIEDCLIITIDTQRIEKLYDVCEKDILKEEGVVLTSRIRGFCECEAEKNYEYSEKGIKYMSQAFQKALKKYCISGFL